MDTSVDRAGHSESPAEDNPARGPLLAFLAVALPTGWVLLGIAVALDLPEEPFVLGTLLLGLVAPTIVLTRREPGAGVRALLRDVVRMPRPAWLLLPALVLVPGLTCAIAAATGDAPALTGDLLLAGVVDVVTSVLIVNLWEEMAWQGFFQRRATARWGFVLGALATAAGFVGVHLALAFSGADGASDVGLGLAALVVSGIGLRLFLGALDRWSGRSLLAVAVAHASFNVAGEFVDDSADWIRYAVALALGLGVLATGVARSSRVH
ncbi:MAG TPA: CPBP family intramembrane glutamic endopeptidase [Marmoricola sp.]|nr:CPBP family intramembrane glutamic endopeptidase [Marmoricola sp.]